MINCIWKNKESEAGWYLNNPEDLLVGQKISTLIIHAYSWETKTPKGQIFTTNCESFQDIALQYLSS